MSIEDALKAPLMGEEGSDAGRTSWQCSKELDLPRYRKTSKVKKALILSFSILPWTLLSLLGVWSWSLWEENKSLQSKYYIRPELTYSPAQEAVEYETKIFTTGHPEDVDKSLYAAEPSPEVDELWRGLYPNVFQLIPKEQAVKLVNQTVLFPHDEQRRYVIELDVFHQLHCLNMVRKSTRPDYYTPELIKDQPEESLLKPYHIAHCINAIRQSIMCSSDISVYTWQWNDETETYTNQVKNPHTCRNFDKLRDWSTVNTKMEYFDWNYREMNDPLDSSTWVDGYKGE